MKELMTGNEAIARGAYEAGMVFASAYPGTPSTEILENLSKYRDSLYCEWAPNEKVALEAAVGASIAGGRALCAMKHVGLNVAADPLFTFAYTGVTGGCVIVSADDPGMHSSQNEQDNRNYAKAARVLMLEPSDSQEAKDMTIKAFELSERFNTPVLLRVTTRVCHSKGLVELGERKTDVIFDYEKNIKKYVATPANAKVHRVELEKRLAAMQEYSSFESELNFVEKNQDKSTGEEVNAEKQLGGTKSETGVISSGIAYQYAREVFEDKGDVAFLKLGMTYPLPEEKIRKFADSVKKLYILEECDPYIEEKVKELGIECIGKSIIPSYDELNADIVRKVLFDENSESPESKLAAVGRPPVMCAGCPHRGFFYGLSKKKNVMVTGDIGCYTLASSAPLNALDTTICMGAGLSAGHGAAKVFEKSSSGKRVVGVLGDSTFFHSGVTSLMDVVYNGGNSISVILDNRITAMTGQQENPGTGYTLMGREAVEADIPMLCEAIGVKKDNIYVIDPLDLKQVDDALEACFAKDEPTVIITRWPCVLKKFSAQDKSEFDLSGKICRIDQEKCRNCKMCVKTGCPAIYNTKDKVEINAESCNGCTVCKQVCPFDAIELEVL